VWLSNTHAVSEPAVGSVNATASHPHACLLRRGLVQASFLHVIQQLLCLVLLRRLCAGGRHSAAVHCELLTMRCGSLPWPCRCALSVASIIAAEVYQCCDHLCNQQRTSGPPGGKSRNVLPRSCNERARHQRRSARRVHNHRSHLGRSAGVIAFYKRSSSLNATRETRRCNHSQHFRHSLDSHCLGPCRALHSVLLVPAKGSFSACRLDMSVVSST